MAIEGAKVLNDVVGVVAAGSGALDVAVDGDVFEDEGVLDGGGAEGEHLIVTLQCRVLQKSSMSALL